MDKTQRIVRLHNFPFNTLNEKADGSYSDNKYPAKYEFQVVSNQSIFKTLNKTAACYLAQEHGQLIDINANEGMLILLTSSL